MQTSTAEPPSYGILEQRVIAGDLDRAAEEIARLGYAVIDSGYAPGEIADFGSAFDSVHDSYVRSFGEAALKRIDEYNGIRLPLAFDSRFLKLAMNPGILELAGMLIRNKFILNQQNGIINPPQESYNQGAWHRDLPYQHFLSSRPLAINALYCVDDFTAENGGTFVVPSSHAHEEFPSAPFVAKAARQITAPAGSFIVLNCMVFHRGGANRTSSRRRAVNHVYTTAFIKPQIDIPSALGERHDLSAEAMELLGFRYRIPRTIADFLKSREK